MIIKPAEMKEIDRFEYDGIEQEVLKSMDWRSQLKQYLLLGPAWTGIHEREIVGFAGFYQISPGVAQAWMLFSKSARIHAKSIASNVKAKLEPVFGNGKFHRIQTFVFDGEKAAEKYVSLMGFVRESELEAFGPNKENMIVYKMVVKP